MNLFSVCAKLIQVLFCLSISGFYVYIAGQTCDYGYYFNGVNCEECGLTRVEPNVDRIVGGWQAVPGSWPAQVLFTIYTTSRGRKQIYSYCGGTIISRRTVLTAAHCVDGLPDDVTFVVYAGAHDISDILNGNPVSSKITVGQVVKIIKHEKFNSNQLQNDITLVILKNPIVPSATVNVACLPQKSTDFPQYGTTVFAAGWGTLKEGGDAPTVLNNVNLTVYNPSKCSKVETEVPKNWNNQICAGRYLGGKDTCQGDSGGAIMVRDIIEEKMKFVVGGIVSYGTGCARKYLPGIYTRASNYIDWINENMVV